MEADHVSSIEGSNCATWSGGSMDFSSSNTEWIWAAKDGSPISDNSVSADLQLHSQQGAFNFDLTKARGGNSLNPFVDAAATVTAAGGSSPTSGSSAAGQEQSGLSSSGGSSSSDSPSASDYAKQTNATIAHGIIMGLTFALLFPSGALLIRLFSFKGLVWAHAGLQIFAYALTVVGLGLGVYISVWPSQDQGLVRFNDPPKLMAWMLKFSRWIAITL